MSIINDIVKDLDESVKIIRGASNALSDLADSLERNTEKAKNELADMNNLLNGMTDNND